MEASAKEIRSREERAKKDRENELAYDYNTHNSVQGRFHTQVRPLPRVYGSTNVGMPRATCQARCRF